MATDRYLFHLSEALSDEAAQIDSAEGRQIGSTSAYFSFLFRLRAPAWSGEGIPELAGNRCSRELLDDLS
jgi:hypothetical protein